MSINSRRYITLSVILCISALCMFVLVKARGKMYQSSTLKEIPLTIGQWQGRDYEIPQKVYDILETKDVITREYTDSDGDSVILAIVHAGDNRDSLHPPEYCYIGGGAQLTGKGTEDIVLANGDTLATNKLVMKVSEGTAQAWYWFAAGNRFIRSFYLQQICFLWDAIQGKNLEGSLIRVSISGRSPRLEDKAKAFIREVVPILRKLL